MTANKSLAVASGATVLALLVVAVCVIWILALGIHDWGTLLPVTLFLWFAQPLALLGALLAAVNLFKPEPRARVLALIITNVSAIAIPWAAAGLLV